MKNLSPKTVSAIPHMGVLLLLVTLLSLETLGTDHNASAETPDLTTGSAETVVAVKEAEKQDAKSDQKTEPGEQPAVWTKLKDSWVVSQYAGAGEVKIKGNSLTLSAGDPISGVRWEGPLSRENYEIAFEGRRTGGHDFFCALTFPVGKDLISLVLGGWGGGIVGLSNIDGASASENASTNYKEFEENRWYRIRVRVDEKAISYWIDDVLCFEQPRKGHEFATRTEMYLCEPLGIASYCTDSEIRKLRIRKL